MPELPEVETVCQGLRTIVIMPQKIQSIALSGKPLRQPIPANLTSMTPFTLHRIERRAKYLLWDCGQYSFINHLGMTGSWRIAQESRPHDHIRMTLNDGRVLVYHDPRRFGVFLCCPSKQLYQHALLKKLGPEPLDSEAFTVDYLYHSCRRRRCAIKIAIMNQAVVVGVGNIYAAEALFAAGIHPNRACDTISRKRLARLHAAIVAVLQKAITAGGSTISDFRQAGGSSGYFQHQFLVYGRQGQPCMTCDKELKHAIIGGRSTVYCSQCQR